MDVLPLGTLPVPDPRLFETRGDRQAIGTDTLGEAYIGDHGYVS